MHITPIATQEGIQERFLVMTCVVTPATLMWSNIAIISNNFRHTYKDKGCIVAQWIQQILLWVLSKERTASTISCNDLSMFLICFSQKFCKYYSTEHTSANLFLCLCMGYFWTEMMNLPMDQINQSKTLVSSRI